MSILEDDVINAREVSPTSGSLTVVAGPHGLGKSHFCGTMAEYLDPSEVLVIATLPREVDSDMYQKHDLDTIMCADDEWMPDQGILKATGYDKLMEVLRELRSDTTYKGIIIDNGTEAAELAWHASLEPLGVGDPNDLGKGGNRFAPYTSLREKMEQLIRSLSLLTGKSGLVEVPKLVAVPWHVQPPKESTGDGQSDDEKAKGAEYEGEYLLQIRGSFRRRAGALVDNFVYSDLVSVREEGAFKSEEHYVVQVVPDRERHTKIVGPKPDGDDLLKGKYIRNHWSDFMDLLEREDSE